jgi:hypothetical protein
MSEPTRTQGEILFERYLTTQHLPFEFEKEHAGKSKRPDYTIEWNGNTVVLDVKDFDPPERLPTSFGAFDPYPRIREKVEQGRDKFKEYKECCCALVLYNLGDPFVMLHSPDIMLGSMYGDSGFTFPVNTSIGVGDASKMKQAFLGRGKMIRSNWSQAQNTTISAIITLSTFKPHYQLLVEMIRADRTRGIEECETELQRTVPSFDLAWEVQRVTIWHNAVARIPFPDGLFCGPYDIHFGVLKTEDGMVGQGVTYRGKELPESVEVLRPMETFAQPEPLTRGETRPPRRFP